MIDKNISPSKLSQTAQKILAAARSVFAEQGFNGTRMDEIARRAGVNKATLYYQIGDKETLYANVIHQVIGNVAREIMEAVSHAKNPEEQLRAYISSIAAAVDKNPEIPPIMMREIASGGATLPRLVIEDITRVIGTLAGILAEGARRNLFIETIPLLIHMMIMGSILFYKGSMPIKERQTWLPAELKKADKKIKGDIAGEVTKLILKAVKK